MMLVSLQAASDHLRRDTTADDEDLELKVHAASSAVLNYLKSASPYEPKRDSSGKVIRNSNGDIVPQTDSSGMPIVAYEVRAAVLLMVGYLYKNRDENADGAFEQGYLPKPVTALLYPLRVPAVA